MITILLTALFIVFFVKIAAIVLRLAWGVTKICAGILLILALPTLILCGLYASGFVLFLPLLMLGGAFAAVRVL